MRSALRCTGMRSRIVRAARGMREMWRHGVESAFQVRGVDLIKTVDLDIICEDVVGTVLYVWGLVRSTWALGAPRP